MSFQLSRAAWIAAVFSWLASCSPGPELEVLPLGGDFTLPAADGSRFRLSERTQEVKLLFFGYTHCPDICPQALGRVREVEQLLGSDRESMLTVFVSVDPERDTPERLREWIEFFGVRGVGLVGSPEETRAVAALYGVHYEKSSEATAVGYLVDHTTFTFLLDRKGRVRRLIGSEVSPEEIQASVRSLLRETS